VFQMRPIVFPRNEFRCDSNDMGTKTHLPAALASTAQVSRVYRHHTASYDIIQHHSLYDVRVLIQHHIHFIRTHLLQLSCMRSYDTRQLYASVCDMCCMNPYLPKWFLYLTSSEWVQMIHFSKWALMYCRLCAPPHTQSECCKNCILCTRLLNDVIWYWHKMMPYELHMRHVYDERMMRPLYAVWMIRFTCMTPYDTKLYDN
jgi:hypothetical protein